MLAKNCVAGIGNVGEHSRAHALLNTLLIELFVCYCRFEACSTERLLAKIIYTCTQIKRALARTHSAEHTPVFQSDCDDSNFGTNGKSHLVLITTWDHQWVFGDDDLSRLKTRTLQGIHIYKAKKNNIVFSIIFIKEKQCFNNIWKSNNTVNMYNNLWVTMLVAIVIIINIPLKGFGRRV